jgi:hypothetical protein
MFKPMKEIWELRKMMCRQLKGALAVPEVLYAHPVESAIKDWSWIEFYRSPEAADRDSFMQGRKVLAVYRLEKFVVVDRELKVSVTDHES